MITVILLSLFFPFFFFYLRFLPSNIVESLRSMCFSFFFLLLPLLSSLLCDFRRLKKKKKANKRAFSFGFHEPVSSSVNGLYGKLNFFFFLLLSWAFTIVTAKPFLHPLSNKNSANSGASFGLGKWK